MSFLKDMFGGKGPQIKNTMVGGSAGGLTTTIPSNGGNITVTPDANRMGAVQGVADTFSGLADETKGLRGQVTPGYNDLLTQQLGSIDNASRSAVGNLRTNLASRRVLGSSFGQDTLSRANAEFSKQRKDTIAQTFLQSLDASNKLLQQEYQARTSAAQTGLNELNLEAGMAANLIGGTNQILSQNAQAQAKLDAAAQEGQGKFLGNIFGQVAGPSLGKLGGGLSGLFGGGAAAGEAAGMMAGLEALGPAAII